MNTWSIRGRTLDVSTRALVMGIVNVTPDSFSDGGQFFGPDAAIAHGLELVRQGADLLDIGGESTRPGATPVSLDEERGRVLPVIEGLRAVTDVPLSIDTSKAALADDALKLGADIVNDVTAGGDPAMAGVVARHKAGVVLMHVQGTPQTMQVDPRYGDVVAEVLAYLGERVNSFIAAGVDAERIVIDPGVGFGKTFGHNVALLARLPEFLALGRPICLGVSRKGFIGQLIDRPRHQRAVGSAAAAAWCLARGAAHVIRVHDVPEHRDVVRIAAVLRGNSAQSSDPAL